MHAVRELAPMGGCRTKLVGNEMINPRLPKRNRIPVTLNSLHDLTTLSSGWQHPMGCEIIERARIGFIDPPPHEGLHRVLKRASAGDDDSGGNRTLDMEPLEILQIAIKKRVLVVPFDFQGDPIASAPFDVER